MTRADRQPQPFVFDPRDMARTVESLCARAQAAAARGDMPDVFRFVRAMRAADRMAAFYQRHVLGMEPSSPARRRSRRPAPRPAASRPAASPRPATITRAPARPAPEPKVASIAPPPDCGSAPPARPLPMPLSMPLPRTDRLSIAGVPAISVAWKAPSPGPRAGRRRAVVPSLARLRSVAGGSARARPEPLDLSAWTRPHLPGPDPPSSRQGRTALR